VCAFVTVLAPETGGELLTGSSVSTDFLCLAL
jgi:hypothetical protein